jgi:hypothetical protein
VGGVGRGGGVRAEINRARSFVQRPVVDCGLLVALVEGGSGWSEGRWRNRSLDQTGTTFPSTSKIGERALPWS